MAKKPKASRTTYEAQLMTAARNVGRLERRCRDLRKQLKVAAGELRHERKMLKALAGAKVDPFEQTPPMRVFGETK